MTTYRIDCLQFANWSEKVFSEMRQTAVDAVHVTVAYHGNFRETVGHITQWNKYFRQYSDLIMSGKNADDVARAHAENKTAIFYGFQTPSPIEDDLGLLEVWADLGLRFMQLTYNTQSLLASGYCEPVDSGLTRMGREAVQEMNRLGMVVDMSHSGERSTLEAIECSRRPVAITHGNPYFWHPVKRNKSDTVLKALAESGGMLGLSLYPLHLKNHSDCTLVEFCTMVAKLAEMIGVETIGIGSDLCQDQPGQALDWMRNGRCTLSGKEGAQFPDFPDWFKDNLGFHDLHKGLKDVGFCQQEIDNILGNNWFRFWENSFDRSQ